MKEATKFIESRLVFAHVQCFSKDIISQKLAPSNRPLSYNVAILQA